MNIKKIAKLPLTWIALGMFVCIITCGIIFKTHPIKVIPLCISCFVMFLQAMVNRYAFLVGGLNSLVYAGSSISLKLYAGALNCVLVSFPLQVMTFINWNKNTQNGQTEIKKLTFKGRLLIFSIMVALWGLLFVIFSGLDSPYMVLDNSASVLSMVTTVLCLFRYSEYALLQLVGSGISMLTYIKLTVDDISNIVWIIYTTYSFVCIVIAFITMNKRSKVKG